ncbi:MAG: hypothetical protein U0U67_14490 [Chitinophagales bacterium]
MDKNSTISDFESKSYLLLFFSICVFPFAYLAQYNLPLSDEFTAMYLRPKIGFIAYQKYLLHAWSGRYFGNFLEFIYPLKIQPVFYILSVFITLFLLFFCIRLLARKIISDRENSTLTVFLFVIILNFSPSIGDLIYYVPAIIIYTVSLLLFLVYIWLFLAEIKPVYKFSVFILLNILLLGTSELFIPIIAFTSVLFLFKSIQQKSGIGISSLNLMIVLSVIIFLIHSSGNNNRFDEQGNKFDWVFGINNCILEFLYWTKKFIFALPVLALMLLFLKSRILPDSFNSKLSFNVLLYFLFIYLLAFAPLFLIKLSMYKRLGNIFLFLFLILSVATLLKYLPKLKINAIYQRLLLFLITIIILFSGNIKAAYEDIYFGYTKNYSAALIERYDILEKNKNKEHLELSKIPITRYINNIQDVNDKPSNDLIYDMYKRYYNIDSISIR